MNPYLYLAIHDLACVAAATTLIICRHPWWGLLFILMALTTEVEKVRKDLI